MPETQSESGSPKVGDAVTLSFHGRPYAATVASLMGGTAIVVESAVGLVLCTRGNRASATWSWPEPKGGASA